MNTLSRIKPNAVKNSRALRSKMSDAERLLWKHLYQRQIHGCKFRRQHPIGHYIADFICLDRQLIIEVDGGQHAEQEMYDQQRTAWLNQQGFTVLRFWNNEVLENIEGVMAVIWQSLDLETQPPSQP